MRIFVLGLPHRISAPKFAEDCGFTTKVLNLCAMLYRAGHEVIHLGIEGSQVECTEHVSLVTAGEWQHHFGDIKDPNSPELHRTDGPHEKYHLKWSKRAKLAIMERCDSEKEAIVCVTYGGSQWWAVKGCDQFVVEAGIGHPNAYAEFRVYESYAWLHSHLGKEGLLNTPKWYWPVIPICFDPSLFEFSATRGESFLYFGRLAEDKGVGIAIETARRVGARITICGHGDPGRWLAPHVDCLPPCSSEERKRLLSKCRAVLMPTWYTEPFGRVAIEAALSGAPVICTDWGSFTENVLHGVTGYRCRTMDQFVFAARNIGNIRPQDCRDWAEANFSLEAIAPMYTQYFQDVLNTRDQATGWNSDNPERQDLAWLTRGYPTGREVVS